MATHTRGKVVIINVYVEKPGRRRVSSDHHHRCVNFNRKIKHDNGDQGYDRRADLLRYCQRLRQSASARTATSARLLPPTPKSSPKNRHPETETVAIRRKGDSHIRTPTCLGDCKFPIPGFVNSLTSNKVKKGKEKKKQGGSAISKLKNLIKFLKVHKKQKLGSKTFSTSRKHQHLLPVSCNC